MPTRKVTVTTLAHELGLSPSTVSHVLNGNAKRLKISDRTADRVTALARKRNYIPNQLARSLKRQRSHVIGVLAGNLYNGWAQVVLEGMLSALEPEGFVPLMTVHNWDGEREEREFVSLLARRVEAIVSHPLSSSRELYEQVIARGTPLVFLGEQPPGLEAPSFVGWDSGPAAELAVRHLIEIGRRRIAFLGAQHPTCGTLERLEAYKRTLAEAGLPLREDWIVEPAMNADADEMVAPAAQALLRTEPAPDAIFALNDGLALPLLAWLEARGVRVPEDVAVIGMGDIPGTSHPRLGLSTVVEPIHEMGRAAGEAALELIGDPRRGPIRRLIPCLELKARSTTLGAHAEAAGRAQRAADAAGQPTPA